METYPTFSGDISILIDMDMTIKIVNRSMFDLLQYEEDQLIGSSIGLILPFFELGSLMRQETDYIPFTDTFMVKRLGEEISFSVSASAFKDLHGQLIGIWLLLQDVNRVNPTGIPLIDMENRYKAMTDSSLDAVIVINSSNAIMEWNHRAEELFGWSKEEAIGMDLSELIVPLNMRESHRAGIKRFLATGQSRILNQRLELLALHRDGHEFPVELTATSVKWGDTYLFSSFVRDISQRKEFERQLLSSKEAAETANKAKSQFLATMSHEIRTPLNGIVGMSYLLKETSLDSEQTEYLDYLSKSANALLAIIHDILDFSKIEAGKIELDTEQVDVKLLLEEVIDICSIPIKEKGLAVSINLSPDVPGKVLSDNTRLRQILINIIGNAIKFTNSGGVAISVENGSAQNNAQLSPESGQLTFRVADTGIGIDKQKRDQLFTPFTQLDSTMTRRYGGTGLGLAISKSLAELLGGTIWIEDNDGGGTTFVFTITYFSVEEKLAAVPEPLNLPLQADKEPQISILIAEDNEINQKVLWLLLEKNGYSADLAKNGMEVVTALECKRYDLIFMDVNMPIMDGIEATRHIRTNLPASEQPAIIAVTANAFKTDKEEYLTKGMDDYISKPIQREELLRILRFYTLKQ